MRRSAWLLALIVAAANAYAATIVFQGGRRVQVASYTMDGSYVVIEYQNGRKVMFPLSAIDVKATQAAAAEAAPAATQLSSRRTSYVPRKHDNPSPRPPHAPPVSPHTRKRPGREPRGARNANRYK